MATPAVIQAPTREQQKQFAELDRRFTDAEKKLEEMRDEIAAALAAWDKGRNRGPLSDWVPDRDLVTSFPFDDTDRITIHDGDKALTRGRIGPGLDLDGKRFADAGNVGDFGFDDRFSFSFWVRPRSPNGALISRTPEEPRAEGYSVHLVNGKVQVHLTKRWLDDALRIETKQALKLNEWQHLIVTYDGSRSAEGVRVYINGDPAQTVALLDELNQTFQTKEPLRIGSGGGKASRFDGQIDELRIYARAIRGPDARALAVATSIRTSWLGPRPNGMPPSWTS